MIVVSEVLMVNLLLIVRKVCSQTNMSGLMSRLCGMALDVRTIEFFVFSLIVSLT